MAWYYYARAQKHGAALGNYNMMLIIYPRSKLSFLEQQDQDISTVAFKIPYTVATPTLVYRMLHHQYSKE
jgi:hypothetical protein